MKKLVLFVVICCAFMLVGCGDKTILDSLTDESTVETMESCLKCASGIQSRAEGEAKLDEFSELLKDIKIPVAE